MGLTIIAYLAFFIAYGEEVFTFDYTGAFDDVGGWNIIADIARAFVDILAASVDLLTFGGTNSPLPGLLQTIMIMAIGVPWFWFIATTIRGT